MLGIVMSYAETYYWNVNNGGGFGIKFSAFIYSMAVITLLFSAKVERAYSRNIVNKTIESIGDVSFAVYLWHMFIVNAIVKFGILDETSWMVRWFIGITATIVLIEIIKLIFPKKYHWYLGV